jgi:glycine/D-amino acid oxidase-like deaminating enzyme
MTTTRHDVLITGGGLAGLTLALQLRQRFPDIDIRVLERKRHPVPEAAHKVGESSVEIGANYFDTVLTAPTSRTRPSSARARSFRPARTRSIAASSRTISASSRASAGSRSRTARSCARSSSPQTRVTTA